MMRRVVKSATRDVEDLVPWRRDVFWINKMRKNVVAPVDTMGCHKLADPLASVEVHRYQILVALMLSSQTKDEVNAAAMKRLKDHGLTIDSILAFNIPDLEQILSPVGFYKKKAVYLQETAQILKTKYNGDIPDTVEGLCSLPGVGPKMAHLVMQVAWQDCQGIAVDTHVHRISNRLGWVHTKAPEQTQVELEKILPRSEWPSMNMLLVGFGQTICKPTKPSCSTCLIRTTCPSSTATSSVELTTSEAPKTDGQTPEKKPRKRKKKEVVAPESVTLLDPAEVPRASEQSEKAKEKKPRKPRAPKASDDPTKPKKPRKPRKKLSVQKDEDVPFIYHTYSADEPTPPIRRRPELIPPHRMNHPLLAASRQTNFMQTGQRTVVVPAQSQLLLSPRMPVLLRPSVSSSPRRSVGQTSESDAPLEYISV